MQRVILMHIQKIWILWTKRVIHSLQNFSSSNGWCLLLQWRHLVRKQEITLVNGRIRVVMKRINVCCNNCARCEVLYNNCICVTLKIKFMYHSTASLRQEALVNDKSVTVLPCKQNGDASSEIEQNYLLWQICVRHIGCLYSTSITPKWGLRLMNGDQKKKIVRRALRVFRWPNEAL